MLVDCPLRAAAESTPHAPAAKDPKSALTYQQLDQLAARLHAALELREVKSGDNVAILARNSIEYVALLFAIARIGAVAVPLNYRLSNRELQRQISFLDIRLAITDTVNESAAGSLFHSHVTFDSLEKSSTAAPEKRPQIKIDLEADCCVIFTSGSSGEPKGVALSIGNLYYNALGSNANIRLAPGDSWHLSLPLFHVGGIGIVFRSILAGSQIFIAANFESSTVSQLIDRAEVTHISLVPTMLQRLIASREFRSFPISLKAILLGGAPLGPQLRDQITNLGVPAITSYGMTETASQITATAPGESRDKLATSGRVLPHATIRINSDGNLGVGEILVKGEVVCRRILGSDSSRFTADGWLRTGDIGRLDAGGYLTVLGRKDDMFISGGENIFPQEITDLVEQYREVSAAAVIAVPDKEWGERPLLFVELREGESLNEESLMARLAEDLARYKVPKRVFVLDKMPRTALGKIDKQALFVLSAGLK